MSMKQIQAQLGEAVEQFKTARDRFNQETERIKSIENRLDEAETKNNRLPFHVGNNSENNLIVGEKAVQEFKELLQTKALSSYDEGFQNYRSIKSGLVSGIEGQGGSLAPKGLANEILTAQMLESQVKNTFGFVTTPSDPFEFPIDETSWNVQIMENTEQGQWDKDNDTTAKTGKLTLNHSKLMASTTISTEFQEDALPIAIEQIRRSASRALARKEELEFLFDSSNGLEAKAKDITGESAKVLDTTDRNSAWQSEDSFLKIIEDLPSGYAQLDELIYIIHPRLLPSVLRFPNFVSKDKIAGASNTTGNIGNFFGADIVVSDGLAGNSEDGYSVLVVNRNSVVIGQRRGINIRLFPVTGDQDRMEITMRVACEYPFKDSDGLNVGALKQTFKLPSGNDNGNGGVEG